MLFRSLRFLPLWAALLLCLAVPCLAQFSSNIQGVVQDPSGASVANATVSIRSLETGALQKMQTSNGGDYRFSSLPPGNYELAVENPGFESKQQKVTLLTAQTLGLNLVLQVAGSTQTVEVSAQAPPLDTSESRTQATFSGKTFEDLPYGGQNFLGLVAVAPGVTGKGGVGGGAPGDAPDNFSTEKSVDASGNGRNYDGNTFFVDGMNVTSQILQGVTNLSPNPESIQELSVQTNNFAVTQGIGSSIVTAITTKSGTNQFHGAGAYYFTNQSLRARTEFTGKYEPFKRHDLAGAFGGPVIKNHTFFFASVEPLRSQYSQSTSVQTFESPEFTAFAKANFPNSLGTQVLTKYPLANVSVTGVSQTAQQLFPSTCGTAATSFLPCGLPVVDTGVIKPSLYRNALQYNFRGDQYLGTKDRFYFSMYRVSLENQNAEQRTGFGGANTNATNTYTANWTHTITPTLLNEASYGQFRVQGDQGKSGNIAYRVPNINITGQSIGVNPTWGPATFIQHNYSWHDVLSWVRGPHSIKFGYDGWFGDGDAQFTPVDSRPSFQFNNILDLVQDKPYSEGGVGFDPLTGQPGQGAYGYKNQTNGLFAQDEWKARSNLTLTLGVRWDSYGNPTSDHYKKQFGQLFLSQGSTISDQIANASVRSVNHVYGHTLNNNWSPRIGVAWDPKNDGKWVVRGGFGLYHDWIALGEVDPLNGNPPALVYPSFTTASAIKPVFSLGSSDSYPFGFAFPTIPASTLDAKGGVVGLQAGVTGFSKDMKPNDVLIYQAAVERQLPGRGVAGITYSGMALYNGLYGTDYNRFAGDLLDGTLNRLNSSFGTINMKNNANQMHYNALILSYRQNLTNRLSYQMSYNYSEVKDYGQAGTRSNRDPGNAVPTQFNISQYYADADWDVRHRLSLSGTFFLPGPSRPILKQVLGGWELGGVGILQSGTPLTVFTSAPFNPIRDAGGNVIGLAPGSGDYNADGVNFDFPNAPGTKLPSSFSRHQYINGIFSASDFPLPTPGTEGNLKRSSFRNPNFINIDLTMIKNIHFMERVNLQLKFQFLNALNRVNLQNVDGNLADGNFGKSTSTYDPRVIQLGARLSF